MSRYLKRLASITIWSVGLVALVVPITAQAAAAPTAASASSNRSPGLSPAQKAAWQHANDEGLAVTATARTLAPFLVRAPDGTLSLDAPASVVSALPPKYVGELTSALSTLNAKVVAGELKTTAAGGVFDPKADNLTLQGGWTGYGSDWWHSWYCFSHTDVYNMTNFGVWALTTAGLIVITRLAGDLGVVIGVVVYLYAGWLSVDDLGNGSCLNFGHWAWPNVWVTSQ